MRRLLQTIVKLAGWGLACAGSMAQAQAPRCEVTRPVVFAGLDWDSNAFHTAVARRILKEGFGCDTDIIPGTTVPLINGMARGDIQVIMEVWASNTPPSWTAGVAAGKLVEVGVNFADATQGWFVPRYVVEGPAALAPGLRSVADLPRFKAVFGDPEEPGKGRFLNCPAGWQCELFNTKKMAAYRLDEHFSNFRPGTGAALDAAVSSALKRRRPVLFYYWGPTWLLGQWGKDLVMLQEPAFDETTWKTLSDTREPKEVKAATAYPVVQVKVGATRAFVDQAPQLHAFLKNYRTSAALVSEALAHMQATRSSADEAARHFLQTRQAVWTPWVPPAIAARIKAGL